MSTFPISAAEIAPVVRYLADHSVAEVLARVLVANRTACAADGWKPGRDMDPAPTAVEIIAACPLKRPARGRAAQALRALRYNSATSGEAHLSAEDATALDELFLRVMAGVRWGAYRSAVDDYGPCADMSDHLRAADAIRVARVSVAG